MGKEALVVRRDILFGGKEFQGFLHLDKTDYISVILNKNNHFYYLRGDELEKNKELKQIIPYVWIVNPLEKSVFLYKRIPSKKNNKEYKEKRYLDKYSGGVGGHIDRDTEERVSNPISNAMMRELREEIIMKNYPSPRLMGYLNDDSDSLGSVHFGIVAIAETMENVKARKSEGLSADRFYSIEETDEIFSNPNNEVESWTRISWPFIKEYLKNI